MLARNEDALIAALKAHRLIASVVNTVGALPKLLNDELLAQYVVDAPALYVVPGRFDVRDGLIIPMFTVAAVAHNVAGNEQARKGDGVDIGVDGLMQLAVRALHEQRIGDCSWRLMGGELVDDEIFFGAGLTAMELAFEGSGIEPPADWMPEELDNFRRFHGDMDIEPHATDAQRDGWIAEPPDFSTSAPDAQLDVQLPGASS